MDERGADALTAVALAGTGCWMAMTLSRTSFRCRADQSSRLTYRLA
jgi:hypothetical protein